MQVMAMYKTCVRIGRCRRGWDINRAAERPIEGWTYQWHPLAKSAWALKGSLDAAFRRSWGMHSTRRKLAPDSKLGLICKLDTRLGSWCLIPWYIKYDCHGSKSDIHWHDDISCYKCDQGPRSTLLTTTVNQNLSQCQYQLCQGTLMMATSWFGNTPGVILFILCCGTQLLEGRRLS